MLELEMFVIKDALHFPPEESDYLEEWVEISSCALGDQMSE